LKEVRISDLQLGDLIWIRWNDASIDTTRLPSDHEVESPVHSIGIFLGVRGVKHKHLLLGRSKAPEPQLWEADRIPVSLIDYALLVQRGFLDGVLPKARMELKKIRLFHSKHAWGRSIMVRNT
jgi:hypothetical protein